jgi:diaminohydroxyphosphoribosylaminopyrimidine deaminase/5-amino-6-(5-phosphoribosylamino)uracil reductase
MSPSFYMQLAVDAAWNYQGMTFPNPAVGCTVVAAGGEILSVAAHQKAGGPHAEVLALQKAYAELTGDTKILSLSDASEIHTYLLSAHDGCFESCTLYVTLEPCAHFGKTPSCAMLIRALGIPTVVIGHPDPNDDAAGGAALLAESGCKVVTGVCDLEAHALLVPFVTWQKAAFVTFKWAQRLDGSVDGGTISSLASRERVHKMRDACDLLVIGGNTVREDRPTLDARLVDGKAPDVLIYSHGDDFDRTIPLFSVKGRKVHIENSFDRIKEYRNVLIEGGPGMFEAARTIVDAYLCFIAPSSGGTIEFANTEEKFEILHTMKSGDDLMMWMR